MSSLLEGFGLTEEDVRETFGTNTEGVFVEEKNYLDVEDQRRIRRRLKQYSEFILARYEQGYEPGIIALLVGVSEESIRSRLRKANLFNSEGPGRPKKNQTRPSFL